MKINKIKVSNYKAIQEQEISLDGCSAIITAGNDKGKTSLLNGLIDRFRGERPELIVREGAEEGYQIMELSDGSRIEWLFTQKAEKFAFVTNEGFKITTGVLSTIGERYFGTKFDIDKFLRSTPKEQVVMMQKIVGLDFTQIDNDYKVAFQVRTDANKELKRLQSSDPGIQQEEVQKPDIEKIKNELVAAKLNNEQLKQQWRKEVEKEEQEYAKRQGKFIEERNNRTNNLEMAKRLLTYPHEFDLMINKPAVEKYIADATKWINTSTCEAKKQIPEPTYTPTNIMEMALENAYQQITMYDRYVYSKQAHAKHQEELRKAQEYAEKCDEKVKSLEAERKRMISTANLPAEFEITEDGINYNGLPLASNQISSSAKYIAALKLGSMTLGQLRTLHFDASFLDKDNLQKIQEWAVSNDLQLLIERPDFEGGEIKYEIY